MSKLPIGDPTLSAKEIVGNESQERMGLLMKEEDVARVKRIADRERAPMYVVGETTNDMKFVFEQADGVKPIDIKLEYMFGKPPRTIMKDHTVEETYAPVVYKESELHHYLENVLQLEAVACKDWLTNKVDRAVTGKVARQQCQGELQLPLSDLGAVALDYRGKAGIATSIGHAPQVAMIDPAAGSYYIENLTVAIAKQAWDLFLAVEEDGGFYASVKAGKVQAAVNESNKARHAAVAKRKEVLLGTNQFPNFNEKAGDKKPVEATCCCGGGHTCEKDVPTLNFARAASEFEALRLETEASGKRPKAFMLTIGNLAMRQARAQYSCNFLACAGYEVVDNLGFSTVEEGIEAAMAAKADIAAPCARDVEYADYAVPAFKALNGRAMFIVAGAPACMDDLKAAGIENFIHVRVNVLETLKEFNAKLLK